MLVVKSQLLKYCHQFSSTLPALRIFTIDLHIPSVINAHLFAMAAECNAYSEVDGLSLRGTISQNYYKSYIYNS